MPRQPDHHNSYVYKSVFESLSDAPKSGKSVNVFTKPHCKGICERWDGKRPFGTPYKTHFNCTRCGVWCSKTMLTDKERCPCCNFRPRMMTKRKKKVSEMRFVD